MLLIQLEPPLAYAALATLVVMHVPGATDADAMQWRNLGFQLVLEQELPVLHALFESLRIEPLDYFLPWLQALFVPVLTIDTAARLWDCYMRDGEVFLWRAAIELLRKRTNELLTEGTAGREHVLLLLRQPIDPMLIADKALFKSLQEKEDAVIQWLPLLQQKLPLPEHCWDLYANSYDSEGADVDVGDDSDGDGDGDASEKHAVAHDALPKQGALSRLIARTKRRSQPVLAQVAVDAGAGTKRSQ